MLNDLYKEYPLIAAALTTATTITERGDIVTEESEMMTECRMFAAISPEIKTLYSEVFSLRESIAVVTNKYNLLREQMGPMGTELRRMQAARRQVESDLLGSGIQPRTWEDATPALPAGRQTRRK